MVRRGATVVALANETASRCCRSVPRVGGPTWGVLRISRAVCLACVVLGLAGTAHLLAGGRLPTPGVMAGLGLLVGFLAVLLTGRRCGMPTLVAVMAGTQFGLHAAFEAFSTPMDGLATVVERGHHAMGIVISSPSPSVAPMSMGPMPAWMSVCHVLAALACTVLLAGGEQALWALWSWLAPALPRSASPTPVRAMVAGVNGVRVTVARVWSPATPLRGPPRWAS